VCAWLVCVRRVLCVACGVLYVCELCVRCVVCMLGARLCVCVLLLVHLPPRQSLDMHLAEDLEFLLGHAVELMKRPLGDGGPVARRCALAELLDEALTKSNLCGAA
jgi:hypothetical protein